MDLKTICQSVYTESISAFAATGNIENRSRYLDLERDIRTTISSFSGVKTDLDVLAFSHVQSLDEDKDSIRLAVVFSDFVSVRFYSDNMRIVTPQLPRLEHPVWPRIVDLPTSLFQPGGSLAHVEMNEGFPLLSVGYCFHDGERIESLINELGSLAESGRLMIRPNAMIFAASPRNDQGRRDWKTLEIDPNVATDTWQYDGYGQASIPLKPGYIDIQKETPLASIILPYIKGIPFGVLSQVLNDETHYILDLRLAIKDILKDVTAEPHRVNEILNDKVRPAIDRIERRFKSITQIHALKIAGASTATAIITLGALNATGLAAGLTALFGASGGVLLLREISDYLKVKNEAKELPLYLLWRLAKSKR